MKSDELTLDEPKLILTPKPEDEAAFFAWKQLFYTSLKLQRRMENLVGQWNLALSQSEAMFKAAHRPGLSQQELAEALLLTKGNVGCLVDRLENMGMLERRPDANDRRINRVYLTAEGRRTVAEIFKAHCDAVREMMQPLSEPQLGQLRSMLQLLEPTGSPCGH